jgi:hypothetical protein
MRIQIVAAGEHLYDDHDPGYASTILRSGN